jgi:hypothetical protein
MPTANLADVLDVSRLPRTPRLWVNSATVEDYTDSTGEAALRVTAILDESVDGRKVTGKEVGDLDWAIQQQLQERGIMLFPYIFYAKQSDLDAPEE